MDMTIDQQVELDEALVPHASRLRIGKSNFRLRSDIISKESTLQLVYDVLRLTPLYKPFLVTADVLDIYMQEFWATVIVHHHSIRFKMDNKKCIVNLEYFREMMYICPRFPGQTFDELLFEEEILAFLRFLGHSEEIRKLINGMYHKKNIDFAYLLWEDFVYQVEHKDAKKSNEMYYPRFTKIIIHYFMTKDPSIPRRNKVNWHYVRDDQMFTNIKLVSRHQNIQQFGVMLPVELTNEDIRNYEAYKEYYVIASEAAPPKTKARFGKTKSSSNTTITPPTTACTRILISAKGKQPAKSSKAKGLIMLSEMKELVLYQGFPMYQLMSLMKKYLGISWKSSDEDDDDEVDERSDDQDDDDDDQDDDDQDDNDDDQDTDNDDDDFVHPKLSIHEEEAKDKESFDLIDAEDDDEELYRDDNINLEGRDVQMTYVHTTQEFEDTHVTLTLVNPDGQQQTFLMNRLKVDTLTPKLLAGPTYELMKGSCKSLVELEFFLEEVYKATTDQLDWNNPEGQRYPQNLLKPLPLIPNSRGCRVIPLNTSSTTISSIYVAVPPVVRKLKNLTVKEHFAFNVSLRMFTRSIVIQRRMKDLQLGVESYQKKLNLTKPDTYHSNLKRNEAYTAYSNPKGFIYQNKDKQNRLMRIDELHKFSDGTLNDVRTALDDRLKGIRMRKSDKERAAAMIQAVDKQLKTRRIMRSLEKFV
nr:hypothetical protein [Tanacetum cinerariifolium]